MKMSTNILLMHSAITDNLINNVSLIIFIFKQQPRSHYISNKMYLLLPIRTFNLSETDITQPVIRCLVCNGHPLFSLPPVTHSAASSACSLINQCLTLSSWYIFIYLLSIKQRSIAWTAWLYLINVPVKVVRHCWLVALSRLNCFMFHYVIFNMNDS